ncbi:MAG: LLM class flavin-dependent oxidoreductase, partial [Beijerinckiaceae bacterium]|nr:LLM class flavin-dependent oxidoreductase [Beijerinckiaceae bacterium]
GQSVPHDVVKKRAPQLIAGIGTSPMVGSYDQVAEKFKYLSDCGLDGMAIGMVNYVDEFPILQEEILPRMERLGLRNPVRN